MERYSAADRVAWLDRLQQETFDLIVIGGGITGAGIALDAVKRGLSVALLERRDFAYGTSSRSTKLVHGGLRYLKQLEFGLVHEVGVERAIVHHNARHVVLPERMLLPIVEGGTLSQRLSSVGLWVYDRLAKVDPEERRKMLDRETTLELEPLLSPEGLLGGGLYYEYRTDDARLTIETIKTAVSFGAICLNYMEVDGFVYKDNGYVGGVTVKDVLGEQTLEVRSRRTVNAAGPWVDELRSVDQEGVQGKRLHLTKGVHIVVPKARLPLKQSVYFDVESDNRMCFAIPRGQVTYIGTTDTTYEGDIAHPTATLDDAEYILNATNHLFPSAKLTVDDIESTWAGLRPLIHQDGKSPSELSRRDEVFYSKTGLISIAGGKLTGYRKMAERVTNLVMKSMHLKVACTTKEQRLSGGDFESDEAIQEYIYRLKGEAMQINASDQAIHDLVYRYGTNADVIINKAYELYGTIRDVERRLWYAEIWYGVHYECVNNLCDFLIRRTGRLYFERPSLERLYPYVIEVLTELLDWSEERQRREVHYFEVEYHNVLQLPRASKQVGADH